MVMKVGGGFDGMGVARRGRGGNRWCAGMSLVCVGGRACRLSTEILKNGHKFRASNSLISRL